MLQKETKFWTIEEISKIIDTSLFELIRTSHDVLKENFNNKPVQISTLLNIKSGSCPEDCAYCSQSAHNKAKIDKTKLMEIKEIEEIAKKASKNGIDRLCIAAAWRGVHNKNLQHIIEMIKVIKAEGLTSCASLGVLTKEQAIALKEAGLDFYNHNINTSREHYQNIATTHTFDDRLNTIKIAQDSGLKICCGWILGMGEQKIDRIKMIAEIAKMDPQPESIPINLLVPIEGTPIKERENNIVDSFDLLRIIATTRIIAPKSYIRLSAGRDKISKEMQMLCFFTGVNSIFFGDTLLTTPNVNPIDDLSLLDKMGIKLNKIELENF